MAGAVKKYDMDSPVSVLDGVGAARAKALSEMGLKTLGDLIYHFPRAYENRGDIALLRDGLNGEKRAFVLTVASEPHSVMIRRGMTLTKFRAFDESGSVEVVFFNQPYVKNVFKVGSDYRFYGKLQPVKRLFQLSSPAYEPMDGRDTLRPFFPLYPLTDGITQKQLNKWIREALNIVLPTLADPLPEPIREKEKLSTLGYALEAVHDPDSRERLSFGLRRLMFDEFFYFALAMQKSKAQKKTANAHLCRDTDCMPLLSLLPYTPTGAQTRVMHEIAGDLARDAGNGMTYPMSRILIGDVGCGKTVCAAVAIYLALKNGGQAALMAPTEILARQHYADVAPLFRQLGFHAEILLGSTTAKEKKRIYASLSATDNTRCDLVIGTHALLNEKVDFSDLSLVVTDEQHRFGVMQRAALADKADGCHMLVMSATPIPRTLALILYGDLSISRIDEMPAGRQRVDTFLVNDSYHIRLYNFIRKTVEEGGQVYIVCPAVSEKADDEDDGVPLSELAFTHDATPPLKNAVGFAEELQNNVFPDLKVAFLHGRMKAAEKDAVMKEFADGKIQILVSTTVIEVGVNVPNASLMIIENAERFGLSQLHQLRGRVGRGKKKSYCVLVSDAEGETALQRLRTMCNTYDGYAIAEQDLKLRGPGDFFASAAGNDIRQSGGMSMHLTALCDDETLMSSAVADASALADEDPTLSLPEHAGIKREIERVFRLKENTIS